MLSIKLRELYLLADGEDSGFEPLMQNGIFNGLRFLPLREAFDEAKRQDIPLAGMPTANRSCRLVPVAAVRHGPGPDSSLFPISALAGSSQVGEWYGVSGEGVTYKAAFDCSKHVHRVIILLIGVWDVEEQQRIRRRVSSVITAMNSRIMRHVVPPEGSREPGPFSLFGGPRAGGSECQLQPSPAKFYVKPTIRTSEFCI
eukprot:747031-Hanusia_phi.AAC.1